MAGLFDFLDAPIQEDPETVMMRQLLEKQGMSSMMPAAPTRGSRLTDMLTAMAASPKQPGGGFGGRLAAGGQALRYGLAGGAGGNDRLNSYIQLLNATKAKDDRPDAVKLAEWWTTASEQQKAAFAATQKKDQKDIESQIVAEKLMDPNLDPREKAYWEDRARKMNYIKTGPDTQVTIDQRGELEASKQASKATGEWISAERSKAQTFPTQISNLSRAYNLVDKAAFGLTGDLMSKLEANLAGLGLEGLLPKVMQGSAEARAELGSIMNKTVFDTLGSLGAQVSNTDLSFARNIFGNMDTSSPSGMKAVIFSQMQMLQWAQDRAREMEKFIANYEITGRNEKGENIQQYLMRWAEENPIFDEADQKKIAEMGQATTMWTPAGGSAPAPAPAAPGGAPGGVVIPDSVKPYLGLN